ncbi:TAT-binding protein-like protein 7, AAA ATPase, partial [Elasticomyces elasticus]
VMARLMDAVWRTKADWNRNHVARAVTDAFNAVVKDIEEMQRVAKSSQEEEEMLRRRSSGAAG